MKAKITLLLSALMLVPTFALAAYELVWSDEFNCRNLNTTAWTYEIGTGYQGWGNWEAEYYTNSTNNVYLKDGNLVIKAIKDETQYDPNYTTHFTSGRIKTAGKLQMKYGKIEARIKLPSAASGVWPAFWMLGAQGGWPDCGETDIMEFMCNSSYYRTIKSTIHWNDGHGHAYWGNEIDVTPTEYHVYSVEWLPTELIFKVDNIEVVRANIDLATAPTLGAFHKEFYILLNLAVGGTYVDGYYDPSITEKAMYVDYVRVYQDKAAYPASTLTNNTVKCDEIDPDPKPQPSDCNLAPSFKFNKVYFAPDWKENHNYVMNMRTSGFDFTMNQNCNSQWQAQVFIDPTTTLDLAGGVDYTMKMDIKSNKAINGVTVKLFQRGVDNMYLLLRDGDLNMLANETYHLEMSNMDAREFSDAVLVFDFGYGSEGTTINVNNIVIKETSCVPTEAAEAAAPKFDIWPNPVTDRLNITSADVINNIYVYSIAGSLVASSDGADNTVVLDMSALAKGVYMVAVETADGTETRRVIKK